MSDNTSHPNEIDIDDLARAAVQAITAKRQSTDHAGRQSREFAARMLDELADVKLPEIIELEPVKHWMERFKITPQKLATALTERRRELADIAKAKEAEEEVKAERRRRRVAAQQSDCQPSAKIKQKADSKSEPPNLLALNDVTVVRDTNHF